MNAILFILLVAFIGDGLLTSTVAFTRCWLFPPVAMPPSWCRPTVWEWVAPVQIATGALLMLALSRNSREWCMRMGLSVERPWPSRPTLIRDDEDDDDGWRWQELLDAAEEYRSSPCHLTRHRLDRAIEEVWS